MRRRYNLARLILASAVVLILTPLLGGVDAQARIAFASNRDGHFINREIYVMDADGKNQQRLTNNDPHNDWPPAWFNPAFAVAPAGKTVTMWGWFKQVDR